MTLVSMKKAFKTSPWGGCNQHSCDCKRTLLTLCAILLSVWLAPAHAVSDGNVIAGNTVYTNPEGSYIPSSDNSLSYTVLTVTTSKYRNGTVSVKAADGTQISGTLNIPSHIYIKSGTSYYRYAVTEIPESAFKGQTGITDVDFVWDHVNGYGITTIGKDAFAETTGLTGTIQLPRTITSIGDNAFGVSTSTTTRSVVIGANYTEPTTLKFGSNIFKGRTITNLHILGNFGSRFTASGTVVSDVTNLYYYGDGTKDDYGDGTKHDVDDSYYGFLTALKNNGYGISAQNLYLPRNQIKSFVESCRNNGKTDWIPATVNSITFENKIDNVGTFTLLLYSNDSKMPGPQLAVHAASLDDNVKDLELNFKNDEWNTDLMPTRTGLNTDITMIDTEAFAGNDNLQSITIKPDGSDNITINGNAFAGVKTLRYVDLSNIKNYTLADGYTLTRIPTTTADENTPCKYTKSSGTFDDELTGTSPFGGVPAYTLVFMPSSFTQASNNNTETVNKADGTSSSLSRPLDENYIFETDGSRSCNHFGVYEMTDLDATTASGQRYTWYSFVNPYAFTAASSTYYRQYTANVPASVCLPFAPSTAKGKFYTYKSDNDAEIVITSVDAPAANTPYFYFPANSGTLSSSTSQTISAVTTTDEISSNKMYGVFAGKSMSDVSGAYGMASTEFTYNGKSYPAGTFVKFSSTAYLNPFRSYLLLGSSGAKPAIMQMVIDDTPSGITDLPANAEDETPYYNLQGMKVTSPSKGIYIHNGRKVIE